MNHFRKMFPERATTGEDGICRWSCEIDLKKDRYSRDLMMKVSLIVGGSVFLMMLGAMWMAGDFSFAWIPLIIVIVRPIPTEHKSGIHTVWKMHGNNLLIGYALYNNSIVMVRNPRDAKAMQGLALATGLLNIAAGNPAGGICMAAGAYGTSQAVPTKFSRVRKFHGHAECSMIEMKTVFSPVQIWTHPEDYGMILDFVREHAENAVEMY